MIFRPLRRLSNLKLNSSFNQIRTLRPSIKIGKDRFQVSIDVHQFTKDEIRVKARPEYLVIEGKQERKTKGGQILRQFIRKFKLPDGCSPETMRSELSPEGILTVTAKRKLFEQSLPCETVIPISHSGPEKREESAVLVDIKKQDPCDVYTSKCNKTDKP